MSYAEALRIVTDYSIALSASGANRNGGDCMKRHSDSTLMHLTKAELIKYVRMAERNQDIADANLRQLEKDLKYWEPVRHGRWIRQQSSFGYSVWKCSVCGRTLLPGTSPLLSNMEHLNDRYPYCHCGAKMDKGSDKGDYGI